MWIVITLYTVSLTYAAVANYTSDDKLVLASTKILICLWLQAIILVSNNDFFQTMLIGIRIRKILLIYDLLRTALNKMIYRTYTYLYICTYVYVYYTYAYVYILHIYVYYNTIQYMFHILQGSRHTVLMSTPETFMHLFTPGK